MMPVPTPLPTRVSRACDRCRKNKSRCDRFRPCSLCLRAGVQCRTSEASSSAPGPTASSPESPYSSAKRRRPDGVSYKQPSTRDEGITGIQDREPAEIHHEASSLDATELQDGGADSTINIARRIHSLQPNSTHLYAVDAIPGANDSTASPTSHNKAPTSSYLTYALPGDTILDELLGEYFDSVHWFSLVILVPKFRSTLSTIRTGYAATSEKPFLLLLSTVLGLSAWYRAHKGNYHANFSRRQWLDWSEKLIANAQSQIVDIMDQRSITAVQTLILLGSYYVYHGRPNLSFSLLGATIKAAQALGLHRSSPQMSHMDREERKRVWWTIYTWDRFASVNYGRPLGINEKVCNLEQPDEVWENPMFPSTGNTMHQESICYSPYQRELNKLYQIASPAIERIYRTDGERQQQTAKEYHVLVNEVTVRLLRWRRDLPNHLQPLFESDAPDQLSAEDKAHCLQSLSLYLSFDSLIIILYRPFMKQRLDDVLGEISPAQGSHGTTSSGSHRPSPNNLSIDDVPSHEQLWNAAVRTAKIAELPHLAQLASDGHLINFLTMNLFNAAVVLIVIALSDPLSDGAQEAKRAVARIYRMQVALESRSVLSQQTAAVLRSLVELLTKRESDAILAPVAMFRAHTVEHQPAAFHPISVRGALSVPLAMLVQDEDNMPPPGAPDADGSGRLQYGLESVQRAFVGASSTPLASRNQSRRASLIPTRPTVGETEVQREQSPTYPDVPQGFEWRDFEFGLDDSMHWIWDPAWDNLFSNVQL